MSELLSLNGEWRLGHCAIGAGARMGLHEPGYQAEGLIPATVPGDVHLDLTRAGLIEDPLFGRNAELCYWVENEEWWYRRQFSVPVDPDWNRAELHFAGLDTTAAVWLNGIKIGEHNNFFTPCLYDVTDLLRQGDNFLAVRLDCGLHAAEDTPYEQYYDWLRRYWPENLPRPWIRKPAYMFQWDWSPRLLTCGIWQGVTLRTYKSLAIRDVFLVSELRDGSAQVRVRIEAENLCSEAQQVHFTATLTGDATHSARLEASLMPGWNKVDMTIPVAAPRLWWPNGSGDPYLYNFSLTVSDGEQLRDEWTCRHGIREVELVQEPCADGSQSFYFAVNGQRIFSKGANWAPADCFPSRPDYEGYHALVKAAAEAHFNMYRVNGVGLHEKDSFYDCCDELGVMVWQDFTYSCGHYPDDDAEFVREAGREAEAVVRRLRNHPSLVLWCGNNENEELHYSARQAGDVDHFYGAEIYHRVLPKVCGQLDPTRSYWPSSSYGGEDPNSPRLGDRHTGVRYEPGEEGYRGYRKDLTKFVSEFYAMSAGPRQGLERFLPADQMNVGSPAWEFHNNLFERGMMATLLGRYFGLDAADVALDDYLLYTQIAQAEVLKYSIEHYRRRKYDCGGALFWSYNDCWGTTTSWTIIDYYLNLKPSYYYVRRAMQPVLVSFREEETGGTSIWLTSDSRHEVEGELTYGLKTLGGEEITRESMPVSIPADGSLEVARCVRPVDLAIPASECFWWARLHVDGRVAGEDRYFLAPLEKLAIPRATVRHELETAGGTSLLRLQADTYAWVVHIAAPAGVTLEDNYFDVFPGEEKVTALEGPAELLDTITVSATRKPAA